MGHMSLGTNLTHAPGEARGSTAVASTLAALAPCALLVVLASGTVDARTKGSTEISASAGPLTYAAATADEVSPGPCVTTPSAPVASFGVCEIPRLASLVTVRCVAEVVIARIGGLYGP
jgi:hypothetical protein